MIRKHKKYSKPRKLFDKTRIEEENILKERYGLKNKKEIWKADASIARIRNQAKKLITADEEDKKKFVEKLQKQGLGVESIADSLGLNKEDYLKRRLQTIVHVKKLVNTPKQARQLISHKHVSIGDQVVSIPSYKVSLEEEPDVRINISIKLKDEKKEKGKIEEIKEDIENKNEDIKSEKNKTKEVIEIKNG
ncbi:30S ribosomal protein S4 [Candidatus Pacearchaeota archaeon]|nr:30S ribosomal protein S4 [Candidatus Pacearchaeota archaeon]